jgi:hypothetical protein
MKPAGPPGLHQCSRPVGVGCITAIILQILAQTTSPSRSPHLRINSRKHPIAGGDKGVRWSRDWCKPSD